jgi:hypothetical protein
MSFDMPQLKSDMCRCYGYECNLKRQCKRFLTMSVDKPGLYAYVEHMCSKSINDETTKCEYYIEAIL